MRNKLWGIGLLAALNGCVSIDATRIANIDGKEIASLTIWMFGMLSGMHTKGEFK